MHIIETYIQNLIINLPKKDNPEKINLVIDGGIFNGSYLTGALYFLREMETRNYIKINKVSCCSISSVCAILYYINALDIMPELYNILLKQFKEKHDLNAFDVCFDKIRAFIGQDAMSLLKKINKKLFISYYDVEKGQKIVKKQYKNVDELFETVRKSCFVPFLANGKIVYKKRYFDGVNPYILPLEPNKKNLYIDLLGSDKINYLMSVKNEKTNFHRILSGLLDIHLFFIKGHNTQMCSYINHWSLYNTLRNRFLKLIVEKIIFYFVYIIYILKKFLPVEFYENIIFKIVSKIITELYIVLVDSYCL
jgi:predicted patatin/cPLA2 family phospholipase